MLRDLFNGHDRVGGKVLMGLTGPLPDMSGIFDRYDNRQRPRLRGAKAKKCRHPLADLSFYQLVALRMGRSVQCPGCFGTIRMGGAQ